jgi:hypothetical protein
MNHVLACIPIRNSLIASQAKRSGYMVGYRSMKEPTLMQN